MKEDINITLSAIKKTNLDLSGEVIKPIKEAMIKLYSGEIDEGIRLYEQVLENFPADSRICHDYGALLIMFKRDIESALKYFQASTNLEPKKSVHFFQAGKALIFLDRRREALKYLKQAREQFDYDDFSNYGYGVDEVIRAIENEIYQLNISNN